VAGGPDPHDFAKIINEEREFLERIQYQLKQFDDEAKLPPIKRPHYELNINEPETNSKPKARDKSHTKPQNENVDTNRQSSSHP
jgi:hypothetical protein